MLLFRPLSPRRLRWRARVRSGRGLRRQLRRLWRCCGRVAQPGPNRRFRAAALWLPDRQRYRQPLRQLLQFVCGSYHVQPAALVLARSRRRELALALVCVRARFGSGRVFWAVHTSVWRVGSSAPPHIIWRAAVTSCDGLPAHTARSLRAHRLCWTIRFFGVLRRLLRRGRRRRHWRRRAAPSDRSDLRPALLHWSSAHRLWMRR